MTKKLFRVTIQFEVVVEHESAVQAAKYAREHAELMTAIMPSEAITAAVFGTIDSLKDIDAMQGSGWDRGCIPFNGADADIEEILKRNNS